MWCFQMYDMFCFAKTSISEVNELLKKVVERPNHLLILLQKAVFSFYPLSFYLLNA